MRCTIMAVPEQTTMCTRTLRIDTDFTTYLKKWSTEIAALRQNCLLSESNFLSFAQERGFPVKGVVYQAAEKWPWAAFGALPVASLRSRITRPALLCVG